MLSTANYFLNGSHRNEKYFDCGIKFKPVKVWLGKQSNSLDFNFKCISDFKIFLIFLGWLGYFILATALIKIPYYSRFILNFL